VKGEKQPREEDGRQDITIFFSLVRQQRRKNLSLGVFLPALSSTIFTEDLSMFYVNF